MTNKHNDEELQLNNVSSNKPSIEDPDFLRSSEDRTPVKFDDKTTFDELDDYIFLNQKRKKKVTNYSKNNKDNFDTQNSYSNYPIMRSRTSSHSFLKKRNKSAGKKRMKTWKKIVIAVVSTILAIVLIFISVIGILFYKGSKEMINNDFFITVPDKVQSQNHGEYIVHNGKTYKINDKITSILLMGIDKADLEGTTVNGTGGQSDFNMLMAIDTSTGKTTLINISRDTITDVAEYSAGGAYVGTAREQLCLAFAYGDGRESSCENQVSAVQKLFYNIPIESYFSFDLNGISAINDQIGGVDVVSPESVENYVKGESYHLMGKDAQNFVQTRRQDTVDANNGRMLRQQTYINAFISKTLEMTKQNISTPLDLFNSVSDYSCTNLNSSKITYLTATTIKNGGLSYEMVSVPGEVKMGETYAEFHIDEEKFFEQFLSVYYTPMD